MGKTAERTTKINLDEKVTSCYRSIETDFNNLKNMLNEPLDVPSVPIPEAAFREAQKLVKKQISAVVSIEERVKHINDERLDAIEMRDEVAAKNKELQRIANNLLYVFSSIDGILNDFSITSYSKVCKIREYLEKK